ncbi:hypothetical protein D3870_02800 [Noviherbaspirillum cavernae]|uniref:Preprotein translocase subunit YajC n=1 Tax=Noviherbaspirillum cavernae TaxID=2320862 RepID=A0A418WXY0_9BURK|nr:PP0621 family protein [Noviherbaspirillum cavernae]RJG05086.1 hypothetical protein D3870_02800 [Noviherbaspirillum cavernae]
MKFLIWVIIGILVVAWLLHAKRSLKAPDSAKTDSTPPKAADGGEAMIQCAHCGLHVPLSESFGNSEGLVFCSEEHRRLGVRS